MKWSARLKSFGYGLLWVISCVAITPLWGGTRSLCPPVGEERRDYGTACSPNFAIISGRFGTGSALISSEQRVALFRSGDAIVDRVRTFLNNTNQLPRLERNKDYFNTPAWSRWYNIEKKELEAARLYYWAIYASSQGLSPAERDRALQGMRETTALIATGHLIFGQQFLLRANNLRFTAEEFPSDDIISAEQCLLFGPGFPDRCAYNDLRANAEFQFEEVLTDFTRVFGLNLRDGTTLGDRLELREMDLFRLAVERSAQVTDSVARNLYALGDELHPPAIYRDVIGARYAQTAAVIDSPTQAPTEQVLTLVTQLTTLRQSAQNLIQNLNPLGIDLSYSPLLSYETGYALANEAVNGPVGALELEQRARQANTNYNESLFRQRQELANIRNHFHAELSSLCGISLQEAEALTVADIQTKCDNNDALVKQKYNLMQAALAGVRVVEERLRAIPERLRIVLQRNTTVAHAEWTNGVELAVLAYMEEILRGFNVRVGESFGFPEIFGVSVTVSYNPFSRDLARIVSTREMLLAAKQIQILEADSEAAVRNSLLDQAYEARNLEVAGASANAAIVEYNNLVHRVRTLIALRDQAMRDMEQDHETINVLRIQNNREALDALAKFNDAIRRTYSVAKIVEYETVQRQLPGALNPKTLFKLRRAVDLSNYLSDVNQYRESYDFSSYLNRFPYQNISMGREILGFNRETLLCDRETGFNCRACLFNDEQGPVCCNGDRDSDCQQRMFQEYVRRNTTGDMGGPQTLTIEFSTPLDAVYPGATDAIFLPGVGGNKLAGWHNPLPDSKGVWLTFRSNQGLQLRSVAMRLTQSGHSLYRDVNGCVLEFSPRNPLAFLPYPLRVNPDETSAVILACLQDDGNCFNPTSAFLRRSVYASHWRLEVSAGPGTSNPNLQLDKLQDILLNFDTTGFTISGTCPE